MFKQKNTPLAMDTVLGEYTTFSGNIESEGSIKVLGKVEGDIKASGDVYIEPTSHITGNIYGSNVYIGGYIKGNILAKGMLHLMTQSKVYGDVEIDTIVTDEGAIFQGNCRMIEVNKEEDTNIAPRKSRIKSKRNSAVDD